jgi:hypothetical protein
MRSSRRCSNTRNLPTYDGLPFPADTRSCATFYTTESWKLGVCCYEWGKADRWDAAACKRAQRT